MVSSTNEAKLESISKPAKSENGLIKPVSKDEKTPHVRKTIIMSDDEDEDVPLSKKVRVESKPTPGAPTNGAKAVLAKSEPKTQPAIVKSEPVDSKSSVASKSATPTATPKSESHKVVRVKEENSDSPPKKVALEAKSAVSSSVATAKAAVKTEKAAAKASAPKPQTEVKSESKAVAVPAKLQTGETKAISSPAGSTAKPVVKTEKSTPAATTAAKPQTVDGKNTAKAELVKSKVKLEKPAAATVPVKVEPADTKPEKKEKAKKLVKKESMAEELSGKVEGEEEEEEEYKWWEDTCFDGTVKWQHLEHSGVCFPPDYVPHGIKMKYNGEPIELAPDAEEIAGFYAQLLDTEWVQNPVFRKNFFNDWLEILSKGRATPHPIRQLELCDFTPMYEYYKEWKEKKKNMTKEEKEVLKQQKKEIDEKFGWATVDGRKEKVGNFRIEPPGLFRGRGAHPKAGCLKKRVLAHQVTLNIGPEAKIPEPPPGQQWGKISHDNTVTWLATWTENVQSSQKYVLFAATSSIKGQSDLKKFEKARDLKLHITKIRNDYTEDLRSKVMEHRQRATALYLIDRLALRAGNEKGEDEADTVGCCSLRVEHVALKAPNILVLDFLGKDSIRYYNEVPVVDIVYKNIEIFQRPPKTPSDALFDRLNTAKLNKHLTSLMPGLTAKVFRTFNASYTFQNELNSTNIDATVQEKILSYNRANRQVAILCNHQRSVPKAHDTSMLKMREKIRGMKYQRHIIKQQILELDAAMHKKNPKLKEPESDLDQEYIAEQKRKEEEEGDQDDKKSQGESGSDAKPKKNQRKETNIDKLLEKLGRLQERIKAAKTMMIDKDENKTTALGTSKINYLDPRISAAWCYKYDVPVDKIFNRSLREKFKWALAVDAKWQF